VNETTEIISPTGLNTQWSVFVYGRPME